MLNFCEEANGVLSLSLYRPSACTSILRELKTRDAWEEATIRVPADPGGYSSVLLPDVRTASVMYLDGSMNVMASFAEKMRRCITPLIKQVWSVDLPEYSGTQLVRYRPGGWYETHQDAGADFEDRYFTVICYLNDNFTGGRTEFPYLSHAAVPETGKAIVFPARYFHRAEPVIDGEKYVLVTWILGPIPIPWI